MSTQLLMRRQAGGASALEQLLPLVYGELRRIARRYVAREHPGRQHTEGSLREAEGLPADLVAQS